MVKKRSKTLSYDNDLLSASTHMRESLRILKGINKKADLIAFNATIEGARTRGRLDSFSIVAEQILTQALQNTELSEKLEKLVQTLHRVALESTATRYYELAVDLINKLERNLFGRYCDVQIWSTFDAPKACLYEVADNDKKGKVTIDELETVKRACSLFERLMGIYQVYSDVFLMDSSGMVVAAGKHRNLIGKQYYDKSPWFKAALEGNIHVSDMDMSINVGGFIVRYSIPVKDDKGRIIGVLSTRFNWDYVQEMIDNGKYDETVQAFIISKQGLILANTDTSGLGVYREPLNWLDSGKDSMQGHSGYTIETARNGAPIATGYAKSAGHRYYTGKEWAALLTSRLGNVDFEHIQHRVENNLSSEQNSKDSERMIESEKVNQELIHCMNNINQVVSQIIETNNETNMLAINAAIQAGIAGTEGESFAIIADEISKLAYQSVGFVDEVNKATIELQKAVEKTVAARLSDAARDTIDKIDRTFFERYCDVQAWATFSIMLSGLDQDRKTDQQVSDFLAHLQKVTEVYHDIYLVDKTGTIRASGIKRELIGQNQNSKEWFKAAIRGKIHVSDVYHSDSINGLTMSFSAPVLDKNGEVIGVLSTRFNWNHIYDIIDTVIVDSKCKVNLINAQGKLIGSSDHEGVLKKSYQHLRAFKELMQGNSGFLTETDSEDNKVYSIGYCRTSGYNIYKGKDWSVIIQRPAADIKNAKIEQRLAEHQELADTESADTEQAA